MILTWLWKMFQWFRQSRAASALEAPKGPPAPLGEARADFINDSNDKNNSHVVIFESEEPAAPPPK
jgi:hypothetical protein